MVFDMQKYEYSETVFNIKQKCLKNFLPTK